MIVDTLKNINKSVNHFIYVTVELCRPTDRLKLVICFSFILICLPILCFQVCLIGDSVGSILGYDALCKNNPYLFSRSGSRYGSHGSLADVEHTESDSERPPVCKKTNLETIKQVSVSNPDLTTIGVEEDGKSTRDDKPNATSPEIPEPASGWRRSHGNPHVRHASCPNSRRTSTGSNSETGKFEFEVTDFFMLGSPLALIMAYRKTCLCEDKSSKQLGIIIWEYSKKNKVEA